ncbi:hypothetical protein Tco_0343391 [Tanacetum coccineum]
MFQNILINLMDSIERAIAERGLYKRVHDSRINERTMQMHEGMISKDASEIDNNVAGASHDTDNITEKEIETYKEWVWDFNVKQYIKKLKQEKEELQDQVSKIKNATKAFKQDEDNYVNNIIQLEAKNKDLDSIVCKMGKSRQTLCMLTNEQSLYQENKQKIGLGYTDPYPLGQAIACHPKLYDAEVPGLHYVKPDMHDTVKILNDVEESQVKMKEKQFLFNNENINSLYDTFVPQAELSLGQEYFLDPSTSNVSSESSSEESDVPPKKMPNESKLLKLTTKFEAFFEKLENTKVVLERQLARKVDDSKAEKDQFLKEINHLRTQLENLKGKSVRTKFDKSSILGKPPADKLLINSQISKLWFTSKDVVQKDLSKLVSTQSLPKNEKYRL